MTKNKPHLDVLFSSQNKHKLQEFEVLFANSPIIIQVPGHTLDVIEDGNTYFENSFLKAKAYYDHFKVPVFADDSGLEIEALPDELGVHTANFGGDNLTSKERCLKVLEKMAAIEGLEDKEERRATFRCILCFYLSPEEIYFFEGQLRGYITQNYRDGGTGFGYDPIFVPEDDEAQHKTLAELGEWKSLHSHRARACMEAKKFFSERFERVYK